MWKRGEKGYLSEKKCISQDTFEQINILGCRFEYIANIQINSDLIYKCCLASKQHIIGH